MVGGLPEWLCRKDFPLESSHRGISHITSGESFHLFDHFLDKLHHSNIWSMPVVQSRQEAFGKTLKAIERIARTPRSSGSISQCLPCQHLPCVTNPRFSTAAKAGQQEGQTVSLPTEKLELALVGWVRFQGIKSERASCLLKVWTFILFHPELMCTNLRCCLCYWSHCEQVAFILWQGALKVFR